MTLRPRPAQAARCATLTRGTPGGGVEPRSPPPPRSAGEPSPRRPRITGSPTTRRRQRRTSTARHDLAVHRDLLAAKESGEGGGRGANTPPFLPPPIADVDLARREAPARKGGTRGKGRKAQRRRAGDAEGRLGPRPSPFHPRRPPPSQTARLRSRLL